MPIRRRGRMSTRAKLEKNDRYAVFALRGVSYAIPVGELDGVGVDCLALQFPDSAEGKNFICYPYNGLVVCDGKLMPVIYSELYFDELQQSVFARRVIYGAGIAIAIDQVVRMANRGSLADKNAEVISWKGLLKKLLGERFESQTSRENAGESNAA